MNIECISKQMKYLISIGIIERNRKDLGNELHELKNEQKDK